MAARPPDRGGHGRRGRSRGQSSSCWPRAPIRGFSPATGRRSRLDHGSASARSRIRSSGSASRASTGRSASTRTTGTWDSSTPSLRPPLYGDASGGSGGGCRSRPRGKAALERPERWTARVTYAGEAALIVDPQGPPASWAVTRLPPHYGPPRTVVVPIPAGRHVLRVDYRFDDGSRRDGPAPVGPWATLHIERGRGPEGREPGAAVRPVGPPWPGGRSRAPPTWASPCSGPRSSCSTWGSSGVTRGSSRWSEWPPHWWTA